ncbi:hypothetical protein M081_4637 [Bacteroides fragilis str. 3998 T(B) 4]|nr:hypothetical protein M081_4637 [Bacteroides fragilis str. 3998 T(B) 4]
MLNSFAKVAQIFEFAQLSGCCPVERNEIPYLNQRFRGSRDLSPPYS